MRRDLRARRDLGRILDDTFALHREHWRTLLVASAAVVVPVQLGVLGIGLGWLWSGYESNRTFGEAATVVATQYMLTTPLITAIAIHVAMQAEGGRTARPGAALALALDVFPALFPIMLVAALGVGFGLVLAVVPGLFLAVRWAMVPQAVVIEGQRGEAALRSSWQLVRGRGWWTLVVLLVANLVVGALSAIFVVPAGLLAQLADAQAIELAGTIAGQVVTLPLVGLATTLLYFSLRAGPGPPAPASPPARQDAWERRRQEGWEPPVS